MKYYIPYAKYIINVQDNFGRLMNNTIIDPDPNVVNFNKYSKKTYR